MNAQPVPRCTVENYLKHERAAPWKHEFRDGEIVAMSGGSIRHNLIGANVIRIVGAAARGKGCRTFASDQRVRVPSTRLYTYPDVTVVCGAMQRDDRDGDTLLNPTVLVEVLSPSTEAYDRGEKFFQYSQIESLTDYLLVAQDRPMVEHFARQPGGRWLLSRYAAMGETVRLSIGCDLPLNEIYDMVEFGPGLEDTATEAGG